MLKNCHIMLCYCARDCASNGLLSHYSIIHGRPCGLKLPLLAVVVVALVDDFLPGFCTTITHRP